MTNELVTEEDKKIVEDKVGTIREPTDYSKMIEASEQIAKEEGVSVLTDTQRLDSLEKLVGKIAGHMTNAVQVLGTEIEFIKLGMKNLAAKGTANQKKLLTPSKLREPDAPKLIVPNRYGKRNKPKLSIVKNTDEAK